jgi:trk system potassium uptake protein TrkA
MIHYKFAVIGLGRFGSRIARTLSRRGAEVMAIDNSDAHVDNLRDDVASPVVMDSTDIRALKSQRLETMDAVVVAIGENFEALLLTVTQLMEIKVKRIIARASSDHQRKILERIGVEEILSPEDEVGALVAERLLHPSIRTFLQLPDEYEISEITPPRQVANMSVSEISFQENYNLNLISLKRDFEMEKEGRKIIEKHLLGIPRHNTIIYDTDTIIIMGKSEDIERFIEVNR